MLFRVHKPNCIIYNSVIHTTQRFLRDILEVEEKWLLEYGKQTYHHTAPPKAHKRRLAGQTLASRSEDMTVKKPRHD